MTSTDRVIIFPSRANNVLMKQRIVAANKGLNLLKRKRDALELKLKEIRAELQKKKLQLNRIMQEAIFSIAKAKYMGTDFKPVSVIKPERADVYLRIKTGKVVGVSLPKFALVIRPSSCFPFTGLSRGGKHVVMVRDRFQEAVKLLISLASLEYSSMVLQEAVRQNNMRINGLDYVLIPKFTRTVMYITEELDEFEREDFYRLKRSQQKQRKAKEKFTALVKKLNAAHNELLIPIPEIVEEPFDANKFVLANPVTKDTSEAIAKKVAETAVKEATEIKMEPEEFFDVDENAQEPTEVNQPAPPDANEQKTTEETQPRPPE